MQPKESAAGPFAAWDLSRTSTGPSGCPRKPAKAISGTSKFQERRRAEALLRQQQARDDRAQQARRLACHEPPAHEPQDGQSSTVLDSGRSSAASTLAREEAAFYAKQLMQPEWMIEVPDNLEEDWFVMPRPEGDRCLVIASQGGTVSRLRNGRVLHRFASWLPCGSRGTQVGNDSDSYCILDCIFQEARSTYYIMDLMCWKGYTLYDCSTEFRQFWMQSKLPEARPADAGSCSECRYSFEPVPAFKCSPDGLRSAHLDPVPFERDGCYFLHKDAHYDTEGRTPLALLWKDPSSRFFIDTDVHGVVSQHQHVVLRYAEDRQVCTDDEPPIALGRMPKDFAQRTAATLRPGRLLRFTIKEGGIQFRDGEPCGADLHFEGVANQRRGRADTCSKIIFQHLARTQPILLSHFTAGSNAAGSLRKPDVQN